MDIFALCSNKIQSQNYTFVIPLFLLIQKLYEKSSVSHAHSGLKKYTTFNYLSLLIRASGLGLNCISITSQISKEFYLKLDTLIIKKIPFFAQNPTKHTDQSVVHKKWNFKLREKYTQYSVCQLSKPYGKWVILVFFLNFYCGDVIYTDLENSVVITQNIPQKMLVLNCII